MNPGLADSIDRAAQNNLAELLVFRSCDGGQTFDTRVSCAAGTGARVVSTNVPYARLVADAKGEIPNSFDDTNVLAGVTYVYSLVTRSRGLTVGIIDVDSTDRSAGCLADTTYAACRKVARILTIADTVIAPVATSGPSTAKIYVPITSPAGGQRASARIVADDNATVPVRVTLMDRVISGDYRLIFGNRFIIEQTTNTISNSTTSIVRVQSVIPLATRAGVALTNFVEREVILSGAGPIDFTGVAYTPTVSTNPTTRVENDTLSGLGFVLAVGSRPLYVSLSVIDTGTAPTTPVSFVRRADFPGFLISLNQRSADTLQLERIVEPDGDTLSLTAQNSGVLQFRQENSTRVMGRGLYTFSFSDDAFGHGGPFSLNEGLGIAATFNASLAARTNVTVGSTSPRIGALVGGTFGSRLRAIQFPFTVTSSTGNQLIVAAPARTAVAGATNTFLLGQDADTLRVPVDSLTWLPGDPFVLLEVVEADSIVGGRVVIDPATGARVTQLDTVVAFNPMVLGCNTPRTACNPVGPGPGAGSYMRYTAGTRLVIDYPIPFNSTSVVDLRVTAPVLLAKLTPSALNRVRVVPNPYVVQSQFETATQSGSEPRLIFAGVPARGTLRIYSVSGQLIQQINWESGQLESSGDLAWNLRNRSGEVVGSGLYVFVLSANDERGKQIRGRGKFVVIR
jgi:hypothetical protein